MISKRKAIETIDMALEGYSHGAANALDRLKKHELSPAQLKWLARRCATDIKHIDNLWRNLREYLTNDDTAALHYRK